MSNDAHIEALLARWNLGDINAAEEAILACEPYVRMVVRRRLSERTRARFDSTDIVQSVWVEILRSVRRNHLSFPDADRLRGYLAKAAAHLLIDRLRHHRASLAAECPLVQTGAAEVAAPEHDRPSEVVQADDVWERLRALCPPCHRELLELKRQGFRLAEIAARTGLHEGSIRRILYRLEKRISFDTEAG